MLGTIILKKDGTPELNPSPFQPSEAVKNFTARIKQDYGVGFNNLHRSFREFNDRSLLQIMDDDQRAFNTYIEPPSADPDEAWKYQGVRPITRNKIIGIAAQMTATLLFPNVFAQNDQDEEDKEAALVMRDLIKWNINNSDYETNFLFGVISALVNPAVILKSEFIVALQEIKQKNAQGEVITKKIVDAVLSGLNSAIIPLDEFFIANPYEFDVQRQRFLGRRRFIEYDDAKGIYGEHENFTHVRPGVKVIFNESDGTFYDQKADDISTLVEEFTYYNRREDLQVSFINGIYMGDANLNNPMKHRRLVPQKDEIVTVPIYPFAKSGHEPIDEKRFFYFKSAVAKLGPEQDLVDTMWRMVVDGTFLSVMPPLAQSGGRKIDASVIFPGAITDIGQGSTITPINTGNNLTAGYNALGTIEQSMTESSQDAIRSGISSGGEKTAFEIARLEQNARIQFGLFGKMVARLVTDFGYLMIDDIIMHQTVGHIDEVTGGDVKLKFQTFLLPDQTDRGMKVTKKITFTNRFMGRKMSKEQKLDESFNILEREGLNGDTRLIEVNPFLFSRLKFLLVVQPDDLVPKNEAFERALKLEAWDRMVLSPFANREAIDRDFLFETFAKGESNKYMQKEPGEALPTNQKPRTPLVDQITGSNSLKAQVQ